MSELLNNGCCYSTILSLLSYSGKMSPMNTREELYHMTDKEMARLKVIEKLLEEEISIKDAADVLGLSDRKIKVPKRVNRIPQIISKTEFDMLLSSVDFGPA